MELPRTDIALEDCARHLATHAGAGGDTSAVEAYLAGHLVMVLCAEVEELVTRLIYQRIERGGCDEEVANMLRARRKGMVRNASSKEIADTLGQLSPRIRDTYLAAVSVAPGDEGLASLGNAVAARDLIAHSSAPAITLAEVRNAREAAIAVAQAVSDALEESRPSGGHSDPAE